MDSGSEQWELKCNGVRFWAMGTQTQGLRLLVSDQEALESKLSKAGKAGEKPSS